MAAPTIRVTADAVAAHDHDAILAVGILHRRTHRGRILGAELEDVADFDAARNAARVPLPSGAGSPATTLRMSTVSGAARSRLEVDARVVEARLHWRHS